MSRTAHPRRPRGAKPAHDMARSDAMSRVTNAAVSLADQAKRLNDSQKRLKCAIDLGREWGLSEDEIMAAVAMAAKGRPDRREALELIARLP